MKPDSRVSETVIGFDTFRSDLQTHPNFSAYAEHFNEWAQKLNVSHYLDNVIVFCKSFNAHLKDINMVLSKLRQVRASLNLKKCCYFADIVKYLEYIIMVL